MPPSRKSSNRAISLLFILQFSLIAAFPSKPEDLSLVLAGRSVGTAASTFDWQINQDGSITGIPIMELFSTGEARSDGKLEDTLPGYGDDNSQTNSQAELISADPSEISRCGQNPEGSSQAPSGKGRFKRQTLDECIPDANFAKPGVVEQKVPVKNQNQGQIPGQIPDEQKLQDPGLHWEPFYRTQNPPPSRTNDGKCSTLEYKVAVCFAPSRSVPAIALLGGLMGLLDPVSLDRMLTLMIPCETRQRGP